MSAVLGIDPSYTGTGLVLIDSDTGKEMNQLLIKTQSSQGIIDRVRLIISKINNFIPAVALDIVAIEGFSYGSPQFAHQMGYLGFRIREALGGYKIIEPSPNQVKKFATGKGNAEKDTIIKEVYKRWNFDTNNNNIADAYVMAQIGRAYLNTSSPCFHDLTVFQEEVIAALKGEKPAKKTRKKKVE